VDEEGQSRVNSGGSVHFDSTTMASRLLSRTMATLTRARQSTPVVISYTTLFSNPLSLTKDIGALTLILHMPLGSEIRWVYS
jgi:hypothetical protein